MFSENYKWNYDYARLAFDSGFSFERHKVDDCDKNKICFIDIDRVVKERDIATIEKFIPCVTQFILDAEQAQILDESFVKIFRVSQLSIEYLLFCKRYLDAALVRVKGEIAKLKEENNELSLFVEDLKEHISVLIREMKEKDIATFKCEQCNKVFSSGEFLNSHKKRRHAVNSLQEMETEKLHSEIKELKGRLNSAEKMIQKEQTELKPVRELEGNHSRDYELKKIDELQQKFEDLRVQVQSELKLLQSQHNYQEKYEKLFEKMTLQNSNTENKSEAQNTTRRRESTTQTDVELNSQEMAAQPEVKPEAKNEENFLELNNTKQLIELGGALETKVTSSLEKIETQMHSFWNKLNQMEIRRNKKFQQESEGNSVPPPTKPRTKLTLTNSPLKNKQRSSFAENSNEKDKNLRERITKEEKSEPVKRENTESPEKNLIKEVTSMPSMKNIELKYDSYTETGTSEPSSSDTETVSDLSEKKSAKQRSSLVVKKSSPSSKSKKPIINQELFEHFKEEVEQIVIMGRLQDLGVSPEWKGLPSRSFFRALEIVKHQASLMKKTYPDFDLISAEIEKEIAKKMQNITSKNKGLKKLMKEKTAGDEGKKIKTFSRGKVPSPQIEIKNRKMYETDSESEAVKPPKELQENLKEFSLPYSAVIEELKLVTTKLEDSDKSDVNSVKENNEKYEDQTKGVLKSRPSAGSLTKKKVLFNLVNDQRAMMNRDGGSTTSIPSSVLDGTPRKNKEHLKKGNIKEEKDVEDLSDFDFSDM